MWMQQDFIDDEPNIDSGKGLVPSGNKPLPGQMSTKFDAKAIMDQNTLSPKQN